MPEGSIPSAIQEELKMDQRIVLPKNGDVKDTAYYSPATGQYIIHCQPGDIFFSELLDWFYQALNDHPLSDLFYYDCEVRTPGRGQYLPFFKPSAASPELLLSINYLSRALIRKEKVLEVLPFVDSNGGIAQFEDALIRRLLEAKIETTHIPKVLVTQRVLSDHPDAVSQKRISDRLSENGLPGARFISLPHGNRLVWKSKQPAVAIIIPSKNNVNMLRDLINSILSITEYPNYSINIVDNNSTEPDVLQYYRQIVKDPKIKVIQYDKPFNYSEAINLGVEQTDSELVLFLNNDMKVIDPWWLEELAQWAIRPEIGVAGAKLIRANHMIQHYGIILGMNGFMGHLYLNAPEHYFGLLGSADWYRNFYAVTGACQMVRRSLFNQVGKYNEKYRLVFGDVDFCLRVHDSGYRNMVTPFARLYHYEGRSRGYKSPVEDILYGYDQMTKRLENEDPYFSPNLAYSPIPACHFAGNSIDTRLENIKSRRNFLEKSKTQKQ